MLDHTIIKEAITVRIFEEKLLELFRSGKISGNIHTCVGQEFTAIAFTRFLSRGDFIFSNHRCHGHYISFTKDLKGLIAELMGKKNGVCAGVGGSQHLCNENFFSNGIQGGIVPVAGGIALANRLCNSGKIGIVFIGDGTLGEGIVYETMNIVALWNIPLLIVCENNYYAQSTKQKDNLAGDILKRAEAFGIKTFTSNIWDMDTLLKEAKTSVEYVRRNILPAFHLVEAYRLNPHSKGDDNRDVSEIDQYRNRDPLNIFAQKNREAYNKYLLEIENNIDGIISEHLNAPELSLEDYLIHTDNERSLDFEEIKEIDIRQVELINMFFHEAMGKDPSVVFIGEDVLSPYGGAFKAAKGLSDRFPDRVFTTPISESAITGIANGLAISGFRPFLEIMFGDFTTLCMDQLINHASKFYHMYNKQVCCPIVLRTPMGGRKGYGPTHSQTLDKFLIGIDNFVTVALNTLIDPRDIYSTILAKEKHPVIVIENKADYTRKIGKKRVKNYKFERTHNDYPIARITPMASLPNATIVTYGGTVDIVLDAILPMFTKLDIKPEVIVISRIFPLDYTEILESVVATKKLYVIEEGSSFAGIGSEIISSVTEELKEKIITRRIAAFPAPIATSRTLEDSLLPNVEMIIEKIKESLL